MAKHVAVLMGGLSAEREVSLCSGAACAEALRGEGFEVTEVDVDRQIGERLAALRPDVAFNALHGRFGEDGIIQGVLEMLAIPYTHSGVLASALAMRKDRARDVLAAAGVPIAKGVTVDRLEAAQRHILPPPYVIKPLGEGSSFGVFIVREDQAYPPQELTRSDWAFGNRVLVESYIGGRELTCAVIGEKAHDVIEIKAVGGGWYDYDAKYRKGGSIHILPAELKRNIYQNVQLLSLKAHKALGCRGVSRTDFRYDDRPEGTGELIVLEVNTQPGMTETSLLPEIAAYAGLSFGELVRWMVDDASCDR
ncbi:D-alanine--D-alanine ligase [Beijerinckia indica]|uniref:D-alanine--D-alanine ligase n=1 Tax=Beijerinckia indica subsp. indica (strain ATCC 9039 / DSM 1715 / NCIMB 8712) TaxID=395963 RepID=DDL_BEII9|nr:D-alanine--D-alanine ligase [Beijerinckia indica]B2IGG3.1 RecName: Full=D-alanine--D-alanine ligase; AltName: Full=D-Ala-D-Ala ligase; AltName: Full=D-alanylalanine synthetase [Beijerinckia indica subsp. indica ATCC 9039]ACB94345.1 D-alanine--D-alanine ligase [Beijerinckia indica subsp. indica ATCC 9039]